LYPLKNALVFIQKPILYIKLKEIKYIEFARIGDQKGATNKTFDMSVIRIDSESSGNEQFKSIDKCELKVLIQYFKQAGIKMRQFDTDTNTRIDLNEMSLDLEDPAESKLADDLPEQEKGGRRKRQATATHYELPEDEEEFDDSEDDGSFDENNNSNSQ